MMKKMNKNEERKSPVLAKLLGKISPLELRKTKENMLLAARIADLLSLHGYSQSKFAEKLGKQPSIITRWLSGTHNFTTETLVEICDALGIELSALFEKKPVQTVKTTRAFVTSEEAVTGFLSDDYLSLENNLASTQKLLYTEKHQLTSLTN